MAAKLNNNFLLAQLRNFKCAVLQNSMRTLSAVLSCMLCYQLLHTVGGNRVGKYLSSKSHSHSQERQKSATFYSSLQSACAFVFPAPVNHLQSPKFIAGPHLHSEQLNDFESSPKRMPVLYIYIYIYI